MKQSIVGGIKIKTVKAVSQLVLRQNFWLKQNALLCFDEFSADIADAMIVAGLFTAMELELSLWLRQMASE